jgi:UDP-glucose 4-epimerase
VRILVTGGAGFIGSHIVDAYLRQGHEVSVIDNLITGRRENVNPQANFLETDIRDTEAVKRIFVSGRFDLVSHHAAQMDVRRSVSDPMYDASVNIIGLLNILESCVTHGVKRVIFASSGGAVYGEQDYFPADERHSTRPIAPYGVAKLSSEHYLFYYKAVYQLDSVSLRYANVYGPRQNPKGEAGVVAIFASKMLAGEQPVINGDGKQTRDYVFVGDVVEANMLALRCPGSDVFNVGTGIETDVNTLFHALKHATRSGCAEQHVPAKKGEQLRSVLDTQKIRTTLGWKPTVTLEEGLGRTVDYFRNSQAHVA